MRLRRLNQQGLQRLADELQRIRTGESKALSRDLERNDEFSQDVTPSVELAKRTFGNRFAAAEYLYSLFGSGVVPGLEAEIGVWAWMSVFYFDELAPPDDGGKRRPGEVARWIPDLSNFRKYYRHLLAGPYRIYRLHADNPGRALVMLCGTMDKPGDLNEQLASRQEIVTNPAIIQTATELYIDQGSNQPKRGSAGSGPGSVRRFARVMGQYDVTWDLNLMGHEELLSMLPGEFERYRS